MSKRPGLSRVILPAALALSLVACGRAPHKAPAPAPAKAEEVHQSGWILTDTPTQTAVTYQDGATLTGFSLSCRQAQKVLHVVAPSPADAGAPAAGETATLVLGASPFETPVTQMIDARVPFLLADMTLTPQLLIALGDAKTLRLQFRAGSSETGVDEDGKIVTFAQQCARLTGVEPAL